MTDRADFDACLTGQWDPDDPGHRRCVAQLVDMANVVGRQFTSGDVKGNYEIVVDHVCRGDLVFAVWEEAGKPFDVGTLLIKGEEVCEAALGVDTPRAVNVTAIPCEDAEHAAALCQEAIEKRWWGKGLWRGARHRKTLH